MISINFRVWVELKPEGSSSKPDQIGYMNVVPQLAENCGTASKPNFESFDVTLKRLNEQLAQDPIPGIILVCFLVRVFFFLSFFL